MLGPLQILLRCAEQLVSELPGLRRALKVIEDPIGALAVFAGGGGQKEHAQRLPYCDRAGGGHRGDAGIRGAARCEDKRESAPSWCGGVFTCVE